MKFLNFKYAGLVVIVVLVSACSHLVEGEVDYARTIYGAQRALTSDDTSCTVGQSYSDSLNQRQGKSRGCYEALYPKYSKVQAVKKGETISMHLVNAFIEDTPESQGIGEMFSSQAANAEVAIVAHVCEQGINGCSTEFGSKAEQKGRVVYFSDSVKAKQMLNFSYLPIYGPIEYQGKPLVVKLSIIELDINGDQEKSLITTLADLGSKAFAPANNVLATLDKLGRSFLEGDQHDIIFRYSLTLAPEGGDTKYPYPRLSAGNYVFIKKETVRGQQEEEIWKKVKLDHLTGRLVQKCNPNDSYTDESSGITYEFCKDGFTLAQNNKKNTPIQVASLETVALGEVSGADDFTSEGINEAKTEFYQDFRGNTYMTLQVQSGFSEASLDNQQTFSVLMHELEKSQNNKFIGVNTVIEEASKEVKQRQTYKSLIRDLMGLKEKSNGKEQKILDSYSIQASKYVDSLYLNLETFNNNCATNVNDKNCSTVPDKNQVTNLLIETRLILRFKKTDADIDTILPLNGKLKKSMRDTIVNILKS